MTSASNDRGGGDLRRPPFLVGPALRVLLIALLALGALGGLAGVAAAVEPGSPLVIGPVEAIPPAAPELPDSGRSSGKGRGDHDTRSGGKRDHQTADALSLVASCAPFSHTQTYAGWGPAVSYGMTVTVLYEAGRCSTPDGSALDVSLEGTAKIFEGDTSAGALLDTRPFLVTGTWREPANAEAWPPAWWGCGVPYANYTWEIPGLYTFQVSARDGMWSLDVSSQGVGTQTVSWTHDGCA